MALSSKGQILSNNEWPHVSSYIHCFLILFSGIGLSILSYNNKVQLGVFADKVLMSEPQILVDSFVKHIDELVEVISKDLN